MSKVIVITGASSGIGLATATALATEGYRVYGLSRSISEIEIFPFMAISMDVTDEKSVDDALRRIIEIEGSIDVLINNAGHGLSGPTYTMTAEHARSQFEVNLFGVVRVSSKVLPGMIRKGKGLIINISSIAGLIGLPFRGLYCASKFALEGYSQSLRLELISSGIDVVVVNPGDFKTAATGNRQAIPALLLDTRLESDYLRALSIMDSDEFNGGDPIVVARKILRIVNSAAPAQNYLVAPLLPAMGPLLKRLLPARLFMRLLNAHYGITK